MSDRIRILLVEDHALVRQGTRVLLEQDPALHVVGEAETAEEALRLIDQLTPDVVLLDIRLRSGSGIDVASALHKRKSPVRVLVVTAHDFEQYVGALVRLGIKGYILKEAPAEDLIKAVHNVYEGHGVLPGKIAATVLEGLQRDRPAYPKHPEEMTVREIEVLELVQLGYRNQAIATRLGISVRTVETHVANIMGKLGATSRNEAIRLAVESGLLKSRG